MNFNKWLFPWKPVDVYLSYNVSIGDSYQCAKFHACIKQSISSYAVKMLIWKGSEVVGMG